MNNFKTIQNLLKTPKEYKTPEWLNETLSALETYPMEIPEVLITHTHNIFPYLHIRIPDNPKKGNIILNKDIHTGLLDFRCGLAIHLPNEGEPNLRLRFGDLLWLKLHNTLKHTKPEKEADGIPWGTPSAEQYIPEDGTPKSGKIAKGATQLHKIPETILPHSVQDTIKEFLHQITGEPMKIGLLKDPIQNTKTLCVITKFQIGGEFNPTPILQALCWHTPLHYTWSAISHHEDEEILQS